MLEIETKLKTYGDIGLLEKGGLLIEATSGNESAANWYILYVITSDSFKCKDRCDKPARFLLYEHTHENKEFFTLNCTDHCPPTYLTYL